MVALENQVVGAQKSAASQAATVKEQGGVLSMLQQRCADADVLARARSEALAAEQRRTNEMAVAMSQVGHPSPLGVTPWPSKADQGVS